MVAKLEGPQFSGGANIAIKCPHHTYDQTIAFYRDMLGLAIVQDMVRSYRGELSVAQEHLATRAAHYAVHPDSGFFQLSEAGSFKPELVIPKENRSLIG